MQLNPEQLKDLALFNAWKAMHHEVAGARLQAQVDRLAQAVHQMQEAEKARQAQPIPVGEAVEVDPVHQTIQELAEAQT